MTPLRGRYAPSPTGELHLGNASSALLAWLSVRSRGGSFVMRVEDIDRNRSRSALIERIFDDLRWMGLDWDEGPDLGGPHAPYEQWPRRGLHREALAALKRAGRVYPCFCSRRDIVSAASAPQAPGDELSYPGTCSALAVADSTRRIEAGDRHVWRFRVPPDPPPIFDDLVHGAWGAQSAPASDFIVFRAQDAPAYQLAVVVDDAAMGINEVVRGDDLLTSTQRQLLLLRGPRPHSSDLRARPPCFSDPTDHGSPSATGASPSASSARAGSAPDRSRRPPGPPAVPPSGRRNPLPPRVILRRGFSLKELRQPEKADS